MTQIVKTLSFSLFQSKRESRNYKSSDIHCADNTSISLYLENIVNNFCCEVVKDFSDPRARLALFMLLTAYVNSTEFSINQAAFLDSLLRVCPENSHLPMPDNTIAYKLCEQLSAEINRINPEQWTKTACVNNFFRGLKKIEIKTPEEKNFVNLLLAQAMQDPELKQEASGLLRCLTCIPVHLQMFFDTVPELVDNFFQVIISIIQDSGDNSFLP